ncbi:hypothetical protein GOBAR_DD29280 [Gossypium barbadense]|nr:hypothetical protein GOBAR_DD29280 [Gossypium barbadense]
MDILAMVKDILRKKMSKSTRPNREENPPLKKQNTTIGQVCIGKDVTFKKKGSLQETRESLQPGQNGSQSNKEKACEAREESHQKKGKDPTYQ